MTITQAPQNSTIHPASRLATDDRLVYSVTEAGELLGISRAFAYQLVTRGELPVIRLGRRWLVPKRALLALVDLDSQDAGGPGALDGFSVDPTSR
jgi:excisionase family DNA binding protein